MYEFPSPIGELHFSIKMMELRDDFKECFRPLSGSYISQLTARDRLNRRKPVSVPYRGATFLNCGAHIISKSIFVSVPYRGATFLNKCKVFYQQVQQMFPSPIGELHFSIKTFDSTRIQVKAFPSPIGELHFSIPSPQPHVLSGTNRGIAGEK